jgi:hypothetical protein
MAAEAKAAETAKRRKANEARIAEAQERKMAAEAKAAEAAKRKKAAENKKKKQLQRLHITGLPDHINTTYLSRNLSDKEYADLFTYLRSDGVLNEPISEMDMLGDIDYLVFTGRLSRENGLFLTKHRHHIELMGPLTNRRISGSKAKEHVDYVRFLLIEMKFKDHPESVKKVVQGAHHEAVAAMDGIRGSRSTQRESNESEEEPDRSSGEPEKEGTNRKYRGGRFV